MEKRKLNKSKIFVLISILFLTFLIVIYAVRFVHYYKEEHPKTSDGELATYFSNELISLLKDSKNDTGLFYDADKKEYYFKGKVENNYLQYSGRLWRIVSINNENEIKLITDKSQTILNYKNESDYINSYINEWLNASSDIKKSGIFEEGLYKKKDYLTKTQTCIDKISSIEDITCKQINDDYFVGTMSLYEYNRAGGINSYLNTEEFFWTSNVNDEGEAWYIFNKGGVNEEEDKSNIYYGIKATITMKEKLIMTSGKGTEKDPYMIFDEGESNLSNRLIGEYVSFEGYNWRIIDKTETAVKVAMDGFIKDGEEDLIKPFSTKKSETDLSDKTSILYYLNNTFYNSLENKDFIVSGNFNVNAIGLEEIDYKNFEEKNVEAKIGLYSFGEFFISNYNDYFLMNNSSDADEITYSINESGILFGESYKAEKKIRPVLYLDNTLLSLGNYGTKLKPYILGR